MAVSYTHLDVYKRQDISPIWFAWNRIVDTSLGIGISLAVNSFPFHKFKVGGTTVSYTHLDVYKRQVFKSRRTSKRRIETWTL